MSKKRRENGLGDISHAGAAAAVASGDPFPHATLAVAALLLAAVFAVFGQTLRHGFCNYDDQTYICDNRHLAEGTVVQKIAWAFTTDRASNWHPLTWMSHLLDYSIYGLQKPWGHHLTNVLLHAGAAIVLFLVLRRMTGDFWPSALAAAVFAVHPLRVESVAWVAERKDVLSGLLFMLTLWAYARYVIGRSLGRYCAVAALFALGLLAKPTLVTLPFVLLLLDYWPLGRFPQEQPIGVRAGVTAVGRLVAEKIPLFLLAAAGCATTLVAQRAAIDTCGNIALPWRIGNAAVAYVAYLVQFFWPTNMAVLYPNPGEGLSRWTIAAAILVLTVVTVLVVIMWRRSPYLLTGWLWYLGMLVPMIGLVQVGWQARADRYTYLPQIGVCIMLAWGIRQAAVSPVARRCGFAGSLAALAIIAGLACRQTSLWRDDRTLWRHTLDCTKDNPIAHLHLGMAMSSQGRFDEAIGQYQTARRLEQDRAANGLVPNGAATANNLGFAYSRLGRFDEAVAEYERAVKIEPNLIVARVNLSAALTRLGRFDEALVQCKTALDTDPNSATAHNNLAAVLQAQGKLVAAMSHYEKAVELRPNYADARRNLALIVRQVQQTPAAIVRWEEWIDLRPNDFVLMNQAAWLMATSNDPSIRNGKDAVKLAGRAARIAGQREPTILATLAAAYAEAGRFPDAVQTARRALTLARQQKKGVLVKSLEEKLRLYEAGKPYREGPR